MNIPNSGIHLVTQKISPCAVKFKIDEENRIMYKIVLRCDQTRYL